VLLADLLVKNLHLRLQLQLQPLMKMMFQEGVVLMTEYYIFLEDLQGEK
jgi:hypothetical protein